MEGFGTRARFRNSGRTLYDELEDQVYQKKKPPPSPFTVAVKLLGVLFGILILYIIIVPSPIDPRPIIKEKVVSTKDKKYLPKIQRIGEGELPGPDSIQVDYHGNVYTGLKDGRLVKIDKDGGISELGRTGDKLPNCGDSSVEEKCGRPLGVHLDKLEENLIICDSSKGLLKLDLSKNILSTLIPSSSGINGVPFKFLNSLTIASDEKVYFTDSSWKWSQKDFTYIMLEGDGQGRLLMLDMKTNETAVLLDGLFFANGVALSPQEDFLIIAETGQSRIIRVWIKGDRRGLYDIFSYNLPGFPGNIRNAKGGGYWVVLTSSSFLDFVGPYPNFKSFLAKILPKRTLESLLGFHEILVKLDYYGEIEEIYDTTRQSMSHLTEAFEDFRESVLYLGSAEHDFIGKLQLDSM